MQEYIKKIWKGSGTTTLIISNKEMNDIMKIVQALEDSNILLKGVTKTIKNVTKNIFWVESNNSVMCSYFCIGLIDFMLAGKKLTDYTNLFSSHDFRKNDDIILSYFKNEWK